MKYGWVNKRLGEVCEVITKGTTPTSLGFKFTDHGVNFIKVESLTETGQIIPNKVAYISEECHESLKRSQLKANDILFSIAGALGRIGIVNKEIIPANTNQALAIVRLAKDSGILVSFLAKYFTSNLITEEIEKLKGGAAQQNLSLGQLNNLMVPFPPLPEQQRIVSILDGAFAVIERSRNNAEQNLKNARELFESVLSSILYDEKWKRKELGEVCNKVEYGSSTKSKSKGRLPVLRMGNIQNSFFTWDSLVYSDDEDDNKQYLLKYNDVLFNRTNSPELVGKTAIYKGELPAIFAGYLIRIHRKEDLLDADYLNYYLNSKMAKEYGKTVVISSVNQANINGTKLKTYPIPLPTFKEQQTIVAKLNALSSETKRLEAIYQQKIADLEELKKSVLQKAFNGELKTEKEEKQVIDG
jgi:type I restriction enzyme S subunit